MKALSRIFLSIGVFVLGSAVWGQNASPPDPLRVESYIQPPKIIADLVAAPRHLNVTLSDLSPDGRLFLITRSAGMPQLADMAKPYVNLGGVQIDTKAHRSRSLTTRGAEGYDLFDPLTKARRSIEAPKGAKMSGAAWSPDGKKVAFIANADDGSYLYVADVASGKSRKVFGPRLMATFVTGIQWADGGKKIVAVIPPNDPLVMPVEPAVALQPTLQVSDGGKNRLRTFPSLLKTDYDQKLLEYYVTGQLAVIDLDSGRVVKVGKPAMIRSVDPSPNGKFFRVTTMQKPFSYLVPVSSFGSKEELWDESGKVLNELQNSPMRLSQDPTTGDSPPAPQAASGAKRGLSWRPDGNGMSYLDAEPRQTPPPSGTTNPPPGEGQSESSTGILPVCCTGFQPVLAIHNLKNTSERPEGPPFYSEGRSPGTGAGGSIEACRADTPAFEATCTFAILDASGSQGASGGLGGGAGQGAATQGPPRRDRVMQWLPPYGKDDVKVVYQSDGNINSVTYSADCQTLFISASSQGNEVLYAVKLSEPDKKYTIYSYRPEPPPASQTPGAGPGFGGSGPTPGTLMTKPGPLGERVARISPSGKVFLSGTQQPEDATKDAPRPFVDAIEIATGKKERLWQSAADVFETVAAVLDDDLAKLVLTRQSATMVPDSYLAELKVAGGGSQVAGGGSPESANGPRQTANGIESPANGQPLTANGRPLTAYGSRPTANDPTQSPNTQNPIPAGPQASGDGRQASGVGIPESANGSRPTANDPSETANRQLPTANLTKLTSNIDYYPNVSNAKRERFQVTRADGFKFWVKVTVPKYHIKGVGLPALFWFYPSEFTDQRAYDRGQRAQNKNLFPNLGSSSKDFLVLLGYAVVEPDCPIVGPTGRMNDNYVPDLRSNLYATINELEKRGFIDRERLAIGGHSYGAFSTANALVHTPYFKAGIAGDGNYNRLLTPSTFQTEQRMLWDARETYLNMSPILFAEQMTGALLMYHGLDDQNVGTDPINSQRMFHALENLGKPAAVYFYPYEDHGQIARETLLDEWARWVAWLDKYVLNAGKVEVKKEEAKPPHG